MKKLNKTTQNKKVAASGYETATTGDHNRFLSIHNQFLLNTNLKSLKLMYLKGK